MRPSSYLEALSEVQHLATMRVERRLNRLFRDNPQPLPEEIEEASYQEMSRVNFVMCDLIYRELPLDAALRGLENASRAILGMDC